jgi:hypothetical protein
MIEPPAQIQSEKPNDKARIRITPTYFRGSQLPEDLFLLTMNIKKQTLSPFLIKQEIALLEQSIKHSEKQLSTLQREETEPRRIGRPPGSLNKKTLMMEEELSQQRQSALEEMASRTTSSQVKENPPETKAESSIITAVNIPRELPVVDRELVLSTKMETEEPQEEVKEATPRRKPSYKKMVNHIKRINTEKEDMDQDQKLRLILDKYKDLITKIIDESSRIPSSARVLRKVEKLLQCNSDNFFDFMKEPISEEDRLAVRRKYKKFEKLCPCCKKSVRRHLCEHTHCPEDCILKKRQDERKKKYNDSRMRKKNEEMTNEESQSALKEAGEEPESDENEEPKPEPVKEKEKEDDGKKSAKRSVPRSANKERRGRKP